MVQLLLLALRKTRSQKGVMIYWKKRLCLALSLEVWKKRIAYKLRTDSTLNLIKWMRIMLTLQLKMSEFEIIIIKFMHNNQSWQR